MCPYIIITSVIFVKVPELLGIPDMSGETKKTACDKLDDFELRLEPETMKELMQCEASLSAALGDAKASCASGTAVVDSSTTVAVHYGRMCNIAHAKARVCECRNANLSVDEMDK